MFRKLRVFFHALLIGRYRCAFYRDAVFKSGVGRIDGDLVFCGVPVEKAEVVVFCFEFNVGQDELVFNELPDYPCHFVPVHLDERGSHFNLFHFSFSGLILSLPAVGYV